MVMIIIFIQWESNRKSFLYNFYDICITCITLQIWTSVRPCKLGTKGNLSQVSTKRFNRSDWASTPRYRYINKRTAPTQASNGLVPDIIIRNRKISNCLRTINKACPTRGISSGQIGMEMFTTSPVRSLRSVRKLIPARKRAATVHIQVGVHNPERLSFIVDAGDKICPRVDENSGFSVDTDQLVCFYTALWWIAWPTERVGYVVKITTGERRTLTLAPSIYSTNCSHINKDK